MIAKSKPDPAEIKKMEDEIRETLDTWPELKKAIAYHYLFATGMTLEKSVALRRKAGVTQ